MSVDALAENKNLVQVEQTLLAAKTWRYLRYMHAVESLTRVAQDVETICVCGAGGGWAEIALAIRFPHIRFTLTDIIDKTHGYPSYHKAMSFCWSRGIDNVAFSIWNVLQPTKRKFDMIMSTEMLEHIDRDREAAAVMRAAASKYVYCLVPYADEATNANPAIQRRVKERAEHERPGYDERTLQEFFGNPVQIAGTYWMDAGRQFREKLQSMTPDEIKQRREELLVEARQDIRDVIPRKYPDALGIKILASV